MRKYSKDFIEKVKELRGEGKTYGEIRRAVGMEISKSTLSFWCRTVVLSEEQLKRIENLSNNNLSKAWVVLKRKRDEFFEDLKQTNIPLADKIFKPFAAKIALAMLCLGEASKSKGASSFFLGNSDPRIVVLFLKLLKHCFDFRIEKVRCTVQCRADQNIPALETYWQKVTNVPTKYFYKSQIDPRTIGKPILKAEYKGVLRVDYFDRKVQLELESLADLIYNRVLQGP